MGWDKEIEEGLEEYEREEEGLEDDFSMQFGSLRDEWHRYRDNVRGVENNKKNNNPYDYTDEYTIGFGSEIKKKKKGQCHAYLRVEDDFGDGVTTFHCCLSANHQGQHQASSHTSYTRRNKPYKVYWEDTKYK